MTLEQMKVRVEIIGATTDDESAHSAEDTLYEEFVRYIAKGVNQFHAQKLAKELLKTKKMKFARWCA